MSEHNVDGGRGVVGILDDAKDESHIRSLAFPEEGFDVRVYLNNLLREFMLEALDRADGVKLKAAELVRMDPGTFKRYLKLAQRPRNMYPLMEKRPSRRSTVGKARR